MILYLFIIRVDSIALATLPKNSKRKFHKKRIPGWNSSLTQLSIQKRATRSKWLASGSGKSGIEWNNMKSVNRTFSKTLRSVKRKGTQLVADSVNLAKIKCDSAGVFRPFKANHKAPAPLKFEHLEKEFVGAETQLDMWHSHFNNILQNSKIQTIGR